jgi:hypothetical protein
MIEGLEELSFPLFGAVKKLLQQPSEVVAKQMVEVTLSPFLKEGHELVKALLVVVERVAGNLDQVRHELQGDLFIEDPATLMDGFEDRG